MKGGSIPISRYIKITSGKGSVEIAERDLQSLLFTDDENVQEGFVLDDTTEIVCHGIEQVGMAFGTESKEYAWASKYFAYSDPNGNGPDRLTFAYCATSEEPSVAYNRLIGRFSNFGVFSFLRVLTPAQVKAVATANAAQNYRFLFVAALSSAAMTDAGGAHAAKVAMTGTDGASGTHIVYQDKIDFSENIVPKTYILSAIISAIDWDSPEGTVSPMYRTLSGETADVDDEDLADDLDADYINYYGCVQIHGTIRAFYQRGVNSDGETALVFMGEVWLKSHVTTELAELMLSSAKIKANSEGLARVYTTVDAAAQDGVTNGVILTGVELDDATRAEIYSRTHDAEAADIISDGGYWLYVWKSDDDDGANKKAKYLLMYAKEDVIVTVEGTHTMY